MKSVIDAARLFGDLAGAVFTVWGRRRQRARCWHHDRRTGQSWVDEQLINTGARKMMWCRRCSKTEFV